jgi:membrane fusion protein, multidrug efflux system
MIRYGVLGAVISLGLMACGGHESGVAAPRGPAVRARLARVEKVQSSQSVELYGTVEAERVTAVSSRVMASVIRVLVKPGDVVQRGQVLLEIDPQTAQGQESQARGALAQAQAGLALAERNFERFKALSASGSASELELDMARAGYEQAKGAVAQAQGAVEAATSVASESKVVAPFAGRVTAKLVEVGDLAAPGRPLVMVESGAGRRLVVAVPESLVRTASLRLGAKIPVRLEGAAAATDATVVEITPGADPAAHTFSAKLALEGEGIPSGVTGRAELRVGSRDVLAVPADAVLSNGSLSLVVIRDSAGVSRTRAVTLGGPVGPGLVEVLSGLAVGDELAIGLAAAPADGTPIEVLS